MDYQHVITHLQIAYNRESASGRDQAGKEDWKVAERQQFLDLLKREGKKTLLEIGAGTGTDGLFFQNSGMGVVCTDLSSAMVERCREKGLEAYVMDFLSLDFSHASFEAMYALNCLLHVPTNDLPTVLEKCGVSYALAVFSFLVFTEAMRKRAYVRTTGINHRASSPITQKNL